MNENNNEQSLNPCNDKSPLPSKLNFDKTPGVCEHETTPNINSVDNLPDYGWLNDASKAVNLGKQGQCDPMRTGQIVNSERQVNTTTLYRYSKALHGCDNAMLDLFINPQPIIVVDEQGKAHQVPIIWATQEKAVAAVLMDNVRKDNSLVVDKIRLPMLAIASTDIQFDQKRYVYHNAKSFVTEYRSDGKPGFTTQEKYSRDTIFGVAKGIPVDVTYTLYVWTMYLEDMNQILEQILLKFSPVAYIRVRGVGQEVMVTLEGQRKNVEMEPGDKMRVIKHEFTFKAATYIPQPISRYKAVLDVKTQFSLGLDADVAQIVEELDARIKEFE